MTTSPQLNLVQQVFALTMESNALGNASEQGTIDSLTTSMQTHLTDYLGSKATQDAIGQWSIVWGPVVYQTPSTTINNREAARAPDNVMYVAANADQSVYVVAIAGTNFASGYDVTIEDATTTPIAWSAAFSTTLPSIKAPPGINPEPLLSLGTATGVNALLSMQDMRRGNITLVDFLRSVGTTGSKKLIFGGHSLAGALAPTLALALFNPSGGPLSTTSWKPVYVLPVAGTTPGSKSLSTFFQQVFPSPVIEDTSQPFYVWNQNIWNDFDLVPSNFVVAMINKFPAKYSPQWLLNIEDPAVWVLLNQSVTCAKKFPDSDPFTQLPNVEVQGSLITTDPAGYPVHDFDSFNAQAGHQHIDFYMTLFGIDKVTTDKAKEGLHALVKSMLRVDPEAVKRQSQSLEKKPSGQAV
jgi:hypothetical protein